MFRIDAEAEEKPESAEENAGEEAQLEVRHSGPARFGQKNFGSRDRQGTTRVW